MEFARAHKFEFGTEPLEDPLFNYLWNVGEERNTMVARKEKKSKSVSDDLLDLVYDAEVATGSSLSFWHQTDHSINEYVREILAMPFAFRLHPSPSEVFRTL